MKPASPSLRTVALTGASLIAFAGNSLLARAALADGAISAGDFTLLRLASGAVMLLLLTGRSGLGGGSWVSAAALAAYALGFSFAYLALDTGTGALLLFGAVQLSMIGWGVAGGERPGWLQWSGCLLAVSGLIFLLAPGITAPPLGAGALMVLAGVSWGVYSIRGKSSDSPSAATAGNFVRSLPIALVAWLLWRPESAPTLSGVALAIASGSITSGLGYALWYSVLPEIRSSVAATLQLAVPVLAAAGGLLLLGETLSLRLLLASGVVLTGVALATLAPARN